MNNIHSDTITATRDHPLLTSKQADFLDIKCITKKRFAEITGITEKAIDSKIARGQWRERVEYMLDPDGKIQIILEGVNRWVLNSQRESVRRSTTTG